MIRVSIYICVAYWWHAYSYIFRDLIACMAGTRDMHMNVQMPSSTLQCWSTDSGVFVWTVSCPSNAVPNFSECRKVVYHSIALATARWEEESIVIGFRTGYSALLALLCWSTSQFTIESCTTLVVQQPWPEEGRFDPIAISNDATRRVASGRIQGNAYAVSSVGSLLPLLCETCTECLENTCVDHWTLLEYSLHH